MEQVGILAILKAKPGRENDVEAFLKSAQFLAHAETETLRWHAVKLDASQFAIFDAIGDEAGREAQVGGEIARQLFAAAVDLFAAPPSIHFLELSANKHAA